MTPRPSEQPRCVDVAARFVGAPAPDLPMTLALSGALSRVFAAEGTASFRRRAVRECFDSLTILRAYREPLAGETWTTPRRSEVRLLAQVEAILCLGDPALTQVADLTFDPDIADPDAVFAALFTLGCVQGEAWLQPLSELFAQAVARSKADAAAAIEAVCLSPNRGVDKFVKALLGRPEPALRAAAVRVLAYRWTLTAAAWREAMADADSAVLAAACLAPVHAYETEDCQAPLAAALYSRHAAVVRGALRCGVALRLPVARQRALELARDELDSSQAVLYLALFGSVGDARVLHDCLDRFETGPAALLAVRAAGVLGTLSLLDALVERLRGAATDDPLRPELASALHAATGLDPNADDVAGLDRDWQALRARAVAVARLRAGRPFEPRVLRDLLYEGPGQRAERSQLYLELSAFSRHGLPRLNCYDFVATQESALPHIDAWLGVVAEQSPSVHGRVGGG